MLEALDPAMVAGAVPKKTAAYEVDLLLRETGWLVPSSQASSFTSLVFYFSISVFCIC